jgi:hypothetical protein
MKFLRKTTRRPRLGNSGMELAGALSVASQMALLCPPGFDELVRRELAGDSALAEREADQSSRPR